MRDASSKPSHHDYNPLFRSFFRANINRFGSHSYDRTRHLRDFVERRRFQLPFWRRPFWRDLLAAVAVPTRSRGRTGAADVFATRWISGCVLLATTCSIAAASAAQNQALLFWLRPTLREIAPGVPIPSRARTAAVFSIGIWLAVAACGRSIAYF